VASGGELSRVYLALQTAARGPVDAGGATLVFDEVDSGIGGAAAAVVGRKLRRLGVLGPVVAVTHLPQVASQGHVHLRLRKTAAGGRTRVTVETLGATQRIEEVARMLGGEEVTALARDHAAELIAEAETAEAVALGGSRSKQPVARSRGRARSETTRK
jgi:DNA repair protein RecN (Recombination protein N)